LQRDWASEMSTKAKSSNARSSPFPRMFRGLPPLFQAKSFLPVEAFRSSWWISLRRLFAFFTFL